MIAISRKIGDKDVTFIYNPTVDGPLEIYKRNPGFTVIEYMDYNTEPVLEKIKEIATSVEDTEIPQEESKDAVLGQTSDSTGTGKTFGIYLNVSELKHNPEVSPIVAKMI